MEENKEIPARNASGIADAGGKRKVVETYAEDMAKVIGDNQDGLIKKIIHGEEQHEREKRNLSPQSKKNRFFMFLGLLFITASCVTLFLLVFRKDAPTVPVEKQFVPLVFTDGSVAIEVSGLKKDDIARKVFTETGKTAVKSGGVEGIYLTGSGVPLGLRKFVQLINGSFIPESNTTLVSDNFLLGAVKSETPGFFILLKTRSIADIFGPVSAWEGKMFSDLHGLAGIDISADNKYLLSKSFEDGIVENKNARILYDNQGNVVLLYVFADDNSVVIASSKEAAREIMLRLASSRVQK